MTLQRLNQLYWLGAEIERQEARLEKLWAKVTSPTVTRFGGVPGGGGFQSGSRQERYLEEMAELMNLIEDNKAELMEELTSLERYIEGIEDSVTRQIFRLRFEDRKEWWEIAQELGGGNTISGVKMKCYRYLDDH